MLGVVSRDCGQRGDEAGRSMSGRKHSFATSPTFMLLISCLLNRTITSISVQRHGGASGIQLAPISHRKAARTEHRAQGRWVGRPSVGSSVELCASWIDCFSVHAGFLAYLMHFTRFSRRLGLPGCQSILLCRFCFVLVQQILNYAKYDEYRNIPAGQIWWNGSGLLSGAVPV